jgi:hypothetical protein
MESSPIKEKISKDVSQDNVSEFSSTEIKSNQKVKT